MEQNKQDQPSTSEIIDDLEHSKNEVSVSAISWWESKRLWFNILVGISGVLGILAYVGYLSIIDVIGIVVWGVIANLLYSTGMTVELLDSYYFDNRNNLKRFRWLFFAIGTGSFCILTYWYARTYFLYMINF